MRVKVTSLYSGGQREYRGTEVQIQEQLLADYPWLSTKAGGARLDELVSALNTPSSLHAEISIDG